MKTLLVLALISLSAPAFAKDHVVNQKNKTFSTKELKIKAGDTVTFFNDEKELTHNVFSLGPKNKFDIQVQLPQKKSTVAFKEKGETEIECAIHPNMKLKVTVE